MTFLFDAHIFSIFIMSKLRNSAKWKLCTVRLPGVCNNNHETTVLAHLNGGGMGLKKNDLFGAFACSACHDEIDGRTHVFDDREYVELAHRQGVERTQLEWLSSGLILING